MDYGEGSGTETDDDGIFIEDFLCNDSSDKTV